MAAALSSEQIAAIESQLSQHPEILQAIIADGKKMGGRYQYTHVGDPKARVGPQQVLRQYGIDFPDAADYQIQVDPEGHVKLDRNNWFERNSDWVLPVATIGTAGAASYLSGAGAATTPAASGGATTAEAATTGVLPSTITAPTAGTLPAGGTGLGAGAGAAASSGGFLSRVGQMAKSRDVLSGAGDAVSAGTQAAGQNRINADETRRLADRDFEDELMRRNQVEQDERNNALKDVYRNSWYTNRQAGPNNTRGITPMSSQYMATLADLAGQGSNRLGTDAQYATDNVDPLKRFEPSKPSTMERIGTWAGPILKIAGLFGGK